MIAVAKRRNDMAELLIKEGADHSLKDPQGNTLLHIAAEKGHTKMLTLLIVGYRIEGLDIRNSKGETPLDIATQRKGPRIIHTLLRHSSDETKEQALLLAVEKRSLEIVSQLLDKVSNPEAIKKALNKAVKQRNNESAPQSCR